MDKPRPIVELLRVMMEWCVENFEEYDCDGLCKAAEYATLREVISESEMRVFNDYVDETRPRRSLSAFGWPPRELQPRLDWLQEQIDQLTNQTND